MSMNETPMADRVHIGFFGRRNAGKSSVVNAITGQELSIVSETKGTTTDPVSKSMELLPLGPVVIIDTPGYDDEGALGEKRVQKTLEVLNRVDLAVLVVDITEGLREEDHDLIHAFRKKDLPFLVVYNKCDLLPDTSLSGAASLSNCDLPPGSSFSGAASLSKCNPLPGSSFSGAASLSASCQLQVSARCGTHISLLKETLARLGKSSEEKLQLVGDLIHPADLVVLVIPIDKAAPKGRLILPQQQVIRDVLEADAAAICVKEYELRQLLESLGRAPALVITDSQVFAKVSADVPPEIPLTSFSILMARKKGLLDEAVRGVYAIEQLKDGDRILIAEGCTHHRQCDDIGSVKIPRWLRNYTGLSLQIDTCSGTSFPKDLSGYQLIIHCGGCMLNEREVRYRMKCAADQQIPITNYGITIAYMQGILKRCIAMFPYLAALTEETFPATPAVSAAAVLPAKKAPAAKFSDPAPFACAPAADTSKTPATVSPSSAHTAETCSAAPAVAGTSASPAPAAAGTSGSPAPAAAGTSASPAPAAAGTSASPAPAAAGTSGSPAPADQTSKTPTCCQEIQ